MAQREAHVGDIGLALELEVTENGTALNISGAAAVFIKLRTPDQRLLTKTATLTNGGTDGLMRYVTVSTDLDVPGRWRYQGYIQNLGGWTGHTSEGQPFDVRQPVG